MREDLLSILRCPASGSELSLLDATRNGDHVISGRLVSADRNHEYRITNGIARFVPQSNYAENFGFQWNAFNKTQLDSETKHDISRQRFYSYTGWQMAELHGKKVLDVGCGAGRFAEVVGTAGARVVAVDYSNAIDACFSNLRGRIHIDAIQADIYNLPFQASSFDFVYCLGVLQHTPDVHRAFLSLPGQLKLGGGRLAVDIYPKLWRNLLWPKYWLRPITSRVSAGTLFRAVERIVPMLLPLSIILGRVPRAGRQLRKFIPVVNYEGIYPLNKQQLREWAILDTYDMLAPKYDQPQTEETLYRWLCEARLDQIEVFRRGFIVGRGTR